MYNILLYVINKLGLSNQTSLIVLKNKLNTNETDMLILFKRAYY